jgi:AraC-like DNA-binding protein
VGKEERRGVFVGSRFSVLEDHLTAPRSPATSGKVVLSKLPCGQSLIGAPAPSLKMVLEGEEVYEIDGRPVPVRPGQFLYLDAGVPCLGTNRSFTTGICLILPFDKVRTEPEEFMGHDPVLGRALVLSTRTSRLGLMFEQYGRQIARRPEDGAAVADALIEKVADAIAEPLGQSRAAIEGLKAAKASTRRELYQRLERARGFLHANEDRQVQLSELSSVAGLSQFHLARYFKMAFGQSPISYHRGLRLARAARMMDAQAECRVADLAQATGYSDEVSLTHAFKRRFGKAPKQWDEDVRARA